MVWLIITICSGGDLRIIARIMESSFLSLLAIPRSLLMLIWYQLWIAWNTSGGDLRIIARIMESSFLSLLAIPRSLLMLIWYQLWIAWNTSDSLLWDFAMVLMKIFNTISSKYWLLRHKSLYHDYYCVKKVFIANRDIFKNEMVLIFFKNTIAKPHVKRVFVADNPCADVKCWHGAQCVVEEEGTVCVCPDHVSQAIDFTLILLWLCWDKATNCFVVIRFELCTLVELYSLSCVRWCSSDVAAQWRVFTCALSLALRFINCV